MYNTALPTRAQLPSSQKLLVSSALAVLTAAILLITMVLPAEYGIDPTGAGQVLGLKKMGEIKQSLAAEAQTAPAMVLSAANAAIEPEQLVAEKTASINTRNDVLEVTLKPGEAAEVKLDMKKGSKVSYQWSATGGVLNVDAHGDPINPPKDFYHGYGKDKQIRAKNGSIEAAFDGKHGWFWRNRSETTVNLALKTNGEYQAIKRLL